MTHQWLHAVLLHSNANCIIIYTALLLTGTVRHGMLFTEPDAESTLGPEGMEKFCEDLGVEPENVSGPRT